MSIFLTKKNLLQIDIKDLRSKKVKKLRERIDRTHILEVRLIEQHTERLAKSVYDYYRYSDSLSRDVITQDSMGIVDEINDREINLTDRVKLITAFTQLGKTELSIAVTAVHLALGHTVISIVKETDHAQQFNTDRAKPKFEQLCEHLLKNGFSKEDISPFEEIHYCDSKHKDSRFTTKLRRCLSGQRNTQRLIVAIHNQLHISRILKVHKQIGRKAKIALLIDEAHELGGYKNQVGNVLHDENCAYDRTIVEWKEPINSHKIYLITATPQEIYYSEPFLYAHSIVRIPPSEKYVGLADVYFEIFNKDTTIETEVNDKKFTLSSNWLTILSNLSKQEPIERINKFNRPDRHPIILLSMKENLNNRQQTLLESMKSDAVPVNEEHAIIIHKNWVVVSKNQEGLRIYHESLRGQTITIDGKKIVDRAGTGEFLFDISVERLLQWLYMNGGVDKFSHIVIIVYNKAKAGITFGSTVTGDEKTDANWHLTHLEAIDIGKTITSAKIEQRIGRITGNHSDCLRDGKKFKPIVYCVEKNKEKLLKSFNFNSTLTQTILEESRNGDFQVKSFVRNIEFFTSHLPNNIGGTGMIKCVKRNDLPNKNSKLEKYAIANERSALVTLALLNPNNGRYLDRFEPEDVETMKRRLNIKMKEGSDKMYAQCGIIYTVVEFLTQKQARIVADVIEQIGKPNVWVPRALIIKNLVAKKNYILNTVRADLTLIQQNKSNQSDKIQKGLNIRRIAGSTDLEFLYQE